MQTCVEPYWCIQLSLFLQSQRMTRELGSFLSASVFQWFHRLIFMLGNRCEKGKFLHFWSIRENTGQTKKKKKKKKKPACIHHLLPLSERHIKSNSFWAWFFFFKEQHILQIEIHAPRLECAINRTVRRQSAGIIVDFRPASINLTIQRCQIKN